MWETWVSLWGVPASLWYLVSEGYKACGWRLLTHELPLLWNHLRVGPPEMSVNLCDFVEMVLDKLGLVIP